MSRRTLLPRRTDVLWRIETFLAGVESLVPVLDAHEFHFEGESTRTNPSLVGVGEKVTFGEFVRGDRRLIIESSYSLGPVKYYVRDLWLEHEPYMRALGIRPGDNAYPGFSDDPLDLCPPRDVTAEPLFLEQLLREMVKAAAHFGGVMTVGVQAPGVGHAFLLEIGVKIAVVALQRVPVAY